MVAGRVHVPERWPLPAPHPRPHTLTHTLTVHPSLAGQESWVDAKRRETEAAVTEALAALDESEGSRHALAAARSRLHSHRLHTWGHL